jgi:uncharacterized protein DUF5989
VVPDKVSVRDRLSLFGEFIEFLKTEKKLWLLPLVILLLVLGAVITLAEVTGLSPLIYALF